MRISRIFLFLTFISLSLAGCGNLLYLSKLGWHQSSITFHSVPIQEILENEGVSQEAKGKIRFIQEVKRYGEEKLGLARTKSYSKYFGVEGSVLHVITASEKDCLKLYQWDFPITGKVTYKSFFTEEGVLKEKRFLEGKGYDTFVQEAGAYSTLGWLKDPIFSPMLQWDEATLANVILHEMTHTTIYFKGQTDFNEQMATFVGNRGAIDFLTEKYGEGSQEVVEAIHNQEDDLLFSRWIDQACERLSNFYSKDIPREEKIAGREEIFGSLKEEFETISFKTDCYKNFGKKSLNNSVLLAYRRYMHRLDNFDAVYEYLGSDLRKMIGFFKEIRASREKPTAYLERWMKEKRIIVPASLQ
ncbi:MAG TPA: aminopeptidase [Thermodesulfobacteriota bacterium]|nr:aminopeptidase [Thermodesulfobacteriota bacterium]